MANTADFLATIYDTLSKMLSLDSASNSSFLQMAWPGYALSAADFKRPDAAAGPYDADIAREVFSQLSNMAPAMNKLQFENSGFEVDDLYEILIASAIPAGVSSDVLATNPTARLFSDAQYEFLQARRGTGSDPNEFYYPCTATPINWYDDAAAQYWPSVSIASSEVKPMAPASSTFAKLGGATLASRGVWTLKAPPQEEAAIKAGVEQALKTRAVKATPSASPAVTTTTKPLDRSVATAIKATAAAQPAAVAPAVTRSPAFVANLSAARVAAPTVKNVPVNKLSATTLGTSVQKLDLKQANDLRAAGKLNVAQQLLLWNAINQKLPSKPPSQTSEGFSISFKFCRVNIDRPWFKLALLSTRNWYMFNTAAKEYSTGSADSNPGMFPLLPTSFIVVRDLKITANWSQEDRDNLSKSVSFGFFDIRNGSLNANTLEVKGLQVIAWISRLMPALPPMASG